ncbi:hypothetical protein EHQ16_03155 [Leptospira kanakyensis]|uniref:Uncharacterized protein n=1 Tax=Leptospira kanakyensis TaxID=2484968 RepID=A0A6N4PUZ5_9LEPT|nr:hypothetical protein [Leptospira kanakyensis]TGK47532.1 hypothetical protein EHQ11_16475 [Leptospira kanakyensis]TGK63465.1 hypothetical protein EHQ16_03155 [Leptospira kanakyensis]TGK67068.1 hypothetical protein EHQ18_18390 [Leptospira kanakyensis]
MNPSALDTMTKNARIYFVSNEDRSDYTNGFVEGYKSLKQTKNTEPADLGFDHGTKRRQLEERKAKERHNKGK